MLASVLVCCLHSEVLWSSGPFSPCKKENSVTEVPFFFFFGSFDAPAPSNASQTTCGSREEFAPVI